MNGIYCFDLEYFIVICSRVYMGLKFISGSKKVRNFFGENRGEIGTPCKFWVYLGVRTCEVFLCFVAIVRVRVYYADFFVFFVLRHW